MVVNRIPISLVIPKKEIADLFELDAYEYDACFNLVKQVRKILVDVYQPKGFNIGINNGTVAGQTVAHAHIHMIRRYEGDVENPQGGVRGVIPSKQHYIRKNK